MRKEWKAKAKVRIRACYWLLIVLCLIGSIGGIASTGTLLTYLSTSDTESANERVYNELLAGQRDEGEKISEQAYEDEMRREDRVGRIALGHTEGVAAQIVNDISSGRLWIMLFDALRSVSHSDNFTIVVFIILSLFVSIGFNFLFLNPMRVTFKRFFMEARIYEDIPMGRFVYLIRIQRWFHVVRVMFVADVYKFLWTLTIVGGIIKSYSYQMVPYILAENPGIGAREAITLSRKMMDGHKWESFKLSISFLGWHILDFFTIGLVGVFYADPYIEMTDAEYYTYIRNLAKEKLIPGAEKLNDVYLYEKADIALLKDYYGDVLERLIETEKEPPKRRGLLGIFENWFGILLVYDQAAREYERIHGNRERLANIKAALEQKAYPRRLAVLPENTVVKEMSPLYYDRHYSLLSLVFIFFVLCFIGWSWEVCLHLVSDGEFVNRGVLHGPWLPIYGSGGIMILIVLNKLRRHPFFEFFSAILLCGILEYTTAWYLETTHPGMRWWNYDGYFLNIDGRVCGEGLLIFGLGGIAIVYVLAPFLDNMFRRIPLKIAIVAAAALIIVYSADTIYSQKHPNQGKGITGGSEEEVSEADGTIHIGGKRWVI